MARTLLSMWGMAPKEPAKPEPEREPITVSETVPPEETKSGLSEPAELLHDSQPKEPRYSEKPPSPKPTMVVTLAVLPAKLRAVKPRVHSFFAKRSVSEPVTRSLSPRPFVVTRPVEAAWPKQHVRQWDACELDLPHKVKRRKRSRSSVSTADCANGAGLLNPLPNLFLQKIAAPTRIVHNTAELAALCGRSSGGHHEGARAVMDHLAERVRVAKPFDTGDYETQLWASKYRPTTAPLCYPRDAVTTVVKWLKARTRELKKGPKVRPRQRKTAEMDNFIVEDEEEEPGSLPLLVLYGPAGCGKTASVYAAAKTVGAFVLECDSSQKRGGKHLSELLSGIGQSHAVHSNNEEKDTRNCVVLIDEVDILYENEASSFWQALDRFIDESRRPIILTCQDLARLPSNVVNEYTTLFVPIGKPDLVRLVDIAWYMALSEGHVLDKTSIARAAVLYQGDLRKTLAHVQFWCQMGIGGRPSGIDWYLTTDERRESCRVLSVGTYVACPETTKLPGDVPNTLERAVQIADALSLADRTGLVEFETVEEAHERVSGLWWPEELLVETPWNVGALDALAAYSYLHRVPNRNNNHLESVLDRRSETLETLATEFAPCVRGFAREDKRRSNIMAKLNVKRRSRRYYANMGIDTRRLVDDADRVLATFFASPFLEIREPEPEPERHLHESTDSTPTSVESLAVGA